MAVCCGGGVSASMAVCCGGGVLESTAVYRGDGVTANVAVRGGGVKASTTVGCEGRLPVAERTSSDVSCSKSLSCAYVD